MTVAIIDIPVSEPTIRPPKGDPGAVDAFAETLYGAASRFEEFGDLAAGAHVIPSWVGGAAKTYGEAATRASGEHGTVATTVKKIGCICSGYGDTLADLQLECDGLVEFKHSLDGKRQQLIADVNAANDVSDAEISALKERAATLAGDYRTLVNDHETLRRKTRENEDLMRSTFGGASTLERALSKNGAEGSLATGAMGRPGAPGTGASATDVKAWWDGLTGAEREAVIATYPEHLGNADGLPADTRDQANRILLESDLGTLGQKEQDGTLSNDEEGVFANAKAADQSLDKAESYLDPITGEPPGGQLWMYDPSAFGGDGRIAVAVGDLDTATDVAVRVPGITNDGQDAPKLTEEAINVYQSARYNGDGSSVASMMWLGYDAPDSFVDPATLTEGRAEDGGGRFADSIDGLRASRDDRAHLTAIGHSYGSTTVAHAATDQGLAVDEIGLVGSPGAGGGTDHASDLGVGEDHVWVGRNSRDIVATFGDQGAVNRGNAFGAGLGNDPSEDDFGANRFEAEDVDRSSWHRDFEQHGNYFRPDSESLHNIGRIVDGSGTVDGAGYTHDPWIGGPEDPEIDRNVRNRDETGTGPIRERQ